MRLNLEPLGLFHADFTKFAQYNNIDGELVLIISEHLNSYRAIAYLDKSYEFIGEYPTIDDIATYLASLNYIPAIHYIRINKINNLLTSESCAFI